MGQEHFSADDWYRFAVHQLPLTQTDSMREHLNEACGECTESSRLWTEVLHTYDREAHYQPPPDAVRYARDLLLGDKPRSWLPSLATFARLIFDSSQQAALVGVRGPGAPTRYQLHQLEQFAIDVRLEEDPSDKSTRLTGQVLNSAEPAKSAEGARAHLFLDDIPISESPCNSSGEFALEFTAAKGLILFLDIRGYTPIGILLPD